MRKAGYIVMAAMLIATGDASAGVPFDHLQCYRLKDPLQGRGVTADLNPEQTPPFALAPGCKVKFPAKLFCTDVEKTNVQPPGVTLPIGGETTRDFLCYAVRCPKPDGGLPSLAVADQFGERTITVRPSKYLCAPAIRGPAPRPTPRPCADLGGGQCSDVCGGGGDECLFVPQGFELVGLPGGPDIVGMDDCRCVPSILRCGSSAAVCATTGGEGGLCPAAGEQCTENGTSCTCQ